MSSQIITSLSDGSSSREDAPGSEATKWLEEYNPQEDSELAKTANELLGTVDDPKFSDTEVRQNSLCILCYRYNIQTKYCSLKISALLQSQHRLYKIYFLEDSLKHGTQII